MALPQGHGLFQPGAAVCQSGGAPETARIFNGSLKAANFTGRIPGDHHHACRKCGKQIPDGVLTCPVCGRAVPPGRGEQPLEKSWETYVLLAFFLGTLGIHNFYARRIACGVGQLLFTLLSCGVLGGISWLWAIIEMFTVTCDGRGVPMRGGKRRLPVILCIVDLTLVLLITIGAIAIAVEIAKAETCDETDAGLLASELRFYSSQGARAGNFLKAAAPGRKVLLVAEPGFEQNSGVKMLADALQESYGGEVVVDTVKLPGNPEKVPIPLSRLMKAKEFDALVEKYADASAIVTTIGLPRDEDNLKFIQQPAGKRPALFLIGLPAGPGSRVLPSLQNGTIAGVIIANPEARYDVPAPSDLLEAFDFRYLLVTRENVEQYKAIL